MSGKEPPARDKADAGAAKAADEKARKQDPHGVGSSGEASAAEPAAAPTSDRHDTETASGDHPYRRRER